MSVDPLVCRSCGFDLDPDEYPLTYSKWYDPVSDKDVYLHDDPDCANLPATSYYYVCTCCAIKFDITDNSFAIGKDNSVYCSLECENKHSGFCVLNVEEPDIVY